MENWSGYKKDINAFTRYEIKAIEIMALLNMDIDVEDDEFDETLGKMVAVLEK